MPDYRDFGQQDDQAQDVGDSQFLGVNNRLAPDQLPEGMVADAINMRLRSGQPETRLGLAKPGWLNSTSPTGNTGIHPVSKFYGVGTFKDPNGAEWVLIVADGYIYRCTPGNTRFALSLPKGLKLTTDCVPVQAFNNVYLFRGRHLQPLVMTDISLGFLDLVDRWTTAGTYQAAVLSSGTPAKEVAYGPFVGLGASGSLTSIGLTATFVTTVEHGFISGADVVVKGCVEEAFNIRASITVIDVNTFTYQFAGNGDNDATGTPVVSNMALYWSALGTRWTLASITRSTNVATATKVTHGFSNGDSVTISGATGADGVLYNGTFIIQNSLANTFDYVMTGTPTGSATGTLVAQNSIVQAGQSPDSNPEAWARVYNVLPNADDAVFTDNRLMVPTAYTPGSVTYDSTSSYTKKDFIVAMDIGDAVHFLFTNELRINQGSADEIVNLVVFDADTLIVLKGQSWGILTGLSNGDLTQVRFDARASGYGSCALRAGIAAGKNILFPVSHRGVCSLLQNQQGQTRSVDVPFSNDLNAVISRINWTLGNKIRMAWWDDKLYVAVPLLDFLAQPPNLVPAGAQYTATSFFPYRYTLPAGTLVFGQQYQFNPSLPGDILSIQQGLLSRFVFGGTFIFDGTSARILSGWVASPIGPWAPIPVLATVTAPWVANANNAILVYDFRRAGSGSSYASDYQPGQWDGYDVGPMCCVKEFFTANYNGKLRLFFIGDDGWVNMMEEWEGQDQAWDASQPGQLQNVDIATSLDTRGYNDAQFGTNKFRGLEAVLGVWNAKLSIYSMTGRASSTFTVRAGVTFSRTRYLRPIGLPNFVEGNANGDFAKQGRGDYSVRMIAAGVTPGYSTGQFQEVVVRSSTRPTLGRYLQLRIVNTQGRVRIKELNEAMAAGIRRDGILI